MAISETSPETSGDHPVLDGFSRAMQLNNLARGMRKQAEVLEDMASEALVDNTYLAPEGMVIEVAVADPRVQIEASHAEYDYTSWAPIGYEPEADQIMRRATDVVDSPEHEEHKLFLAKRIQYDSVTRTIYAYGHHGPWRVKCNESTIFTVVPTPGQKELF